VHPPVADAALLASVVRGDQQALAALYDRHAGWLLLRLSRRCSDAGLVEEVLQDVFVSVWRSAGSFTSGGPAGGWLWTLAARRLVDALRRRAHDGVPVEHTPDHLVPGPEELLVTDLDHGDLARALGTLSAELRQVLQATVLDGLTTRRAAVVLAIPEGTVKTRAARARAQLRTALA